MSRSILLALLALAACVVAGPEPETDDPGTIRDQDFEPEFRELRNRLVQLQKGELKPEQLEQHYVVKVSQARSRREKAIAHFLLGHAIQMTGAHRRPEARREFETAVALAPRFPGAFVSLSALAVVTKDYTLGKEFARKALAVDPEYTPAIHRLGGIALRQGDAARARRYFEQAIDIDPTAEGCQGLASACIELHDAAYVPEVKEDFANRAISAAEGMIAYAPEDGGAHLFRAQVFVSLEQYDRAIESLESSYTSLREERFRKLSLLFLRQLYTQERRVDKVKDTIERLLAREDLEGAERAELEKERAVLADVGETAFLILQLQKYLKVVANKGVSPTDRRFAMRLVLDFFTDPRVAAEEDFQAIRKEIHDTCFGVLKESPPPELLLEMLQFFRRAFHHPPLIRILVFYVYPYGEKNRTPRVRAEAVRSIALLGGIAALPSMLYCLEDDAGEVGRECDKALSDLFGIRSRAGGDGISPLDEAQLARARRGWRAHAVTEEGTEKIVEAIAALRELVGTDAESNREQRINPIANHVANVILLDNDIRWPAWKAGYEFLTAYMGKDFRAPSRRGKPITPEEREGVVRSLAEYWGGAPDGPLDDPPPEVTPPEDPAPSDTAEQKGK